MSYESDIEMLDIDTLKLHNIVHGGPYDEVGTEGGNVITAANALRRLRGIVPVGTWQTATTYDLKNAVKQDGILYVCTTAHTSTTFSEDFNNGYWVVYQFLYGIPTVTPSDFGTITDGDVSSLVQAAIDSVDAGGEVVFARNTTYHVANIKLKTGVSLRGLGGSVLKLLPNATSASYNGGVVDSLGYYPGNVLCTTLTHTGGSAFDNGVRAKDPNNATYLVTDVNIENLIIDGNKAENTLGDAGENASAMGACISLHQAARVTVRNCVLKNARLDGVCLGYTLHGGSDDCVIENNFFLANNRTGLALITGKRNRILGNTVLGSSTALDIEGNFVDEINYQHIISSNYFGGTVAINATVDVKQWDIIFSNNIVATPAGRHGFVMSGGPMNTNTLITNNTFIGTDSTAFDIQGGLNGSNITIINNNIKGYDYVNNDSVLSLNNVTFKGNNIATKYGFRLFRPYRVKILDNKITVSGGSNVSPVFYIGFGNISAAPDQGEVIISGNIIEGSGVDRLLTATEFSDPPASYDSTYLTFNDNDSTVVTSDTYPIDLHYDTIFRRNRLILNGSINYIITAAGTQFTDNVITNSGTLAPLFVTSSLFKKVTMTENKLTNFNLAITRPEYCDISNNTVMNGKGTILYQNTSGGVGCNTITNNRFINTGTAIDYAFEIIGVVGVDWAEGDFSGSDTIIGNAHAGEYTTASSLNTTPKVSNYNSF